MRDGTPARGFRRDGWEKRGAAGAPGQTPATAPGKPRVVSPRPVGALGLPSGSPRAEVDCPVYHQGVAMGRAQALLHERPPGDDSAVTVRDAECGWQWRAMRPPAC